MKLPLISLIAWTEEKYRALPQQEQQRIVNDHLYLADVQKNYPPKWEEKDREMYQRHTAECVPCIASIVVNAAYRRLEEKDIEQVIKDIERS
jgi:hypothetical protein